MIAITGMAILCPLGQDPEQVTHDIQAGCSAIRPSPSLEHLPFAGSGRVDGPDLTPWLKRKKDQKLLPRAAMLAIPVVGRLLENRTGDRESLALYIGVGREPPDEGESEACLIASARDGRLDTGLLSTQGLGLYPPLLPLKSLPNMVLAHVAMIFGIRGPNDAVTGEAGAGLCALIEAAHCLQDGGAELAVAGAADSRVDLGSARDLYRLNRASKERPPGEGAVVFMLERREKADETVLGWIHASRRSPSRGVEPRAHWGLMGDLGTADSLVELVQAIVTGRRLTLRASDDQGAAAELDFEPSSRLSKS